MLTKETVKSVFVKTENLSSILCSNFENFEFKAGTCPSYKGYNVFSKRFSHPMLPFIKHKFNE